MNHIYILKLKIDHGHQLTLGRLILMLFSSRFQSTHNDSTLIHIPAQWASSGCFTSLIKAANAPIHTADLVLEQIT